MQKYYDVTLSCVIVLLLTYPAVPPQVDSTTTPDHSSEFRAALNKLLPLAEPSDDAQIKSGTGVRLPCNTQCYDTEKWQHPHIIAVNLIPNQERVCNT